jgi:prepilin-type N-terminal cleavage/methylation domain-containing protein
MNKRRRQTGYTLVEVVVVIIIVGILATTAMRSMRSISDVTRTEDTKLRLDRLAKAMVGDPTVTSEGNRVSYGYVGDIGALPASLDALVQNPGSYTTWHGPYIRDDYSSGGTNTNFKQDGWGKEIAFSGGASLISSGSGSNITRNLANATSALLHNKVTVVVTDMNRNVPGTAYKDSVRFVLSLPDGAGGVATRTKNPDKNGYAQFDSIPVGLQTLKVVYTPTNDTTTRRLNVNPGENTYTEISLYRKTW